MDGLPRTRDVVRRAARMPRVVLLAMALLLVPLSGIGAGSSLPAPQLAPRPATLLAWSWQGRGQLTPLEPVTLADRTGASIAVGTSTDTQWMASADGSTLVSVEQCCAPEHGQPVVVVRDGATGAERSRFEAPTIPAFAPVLSPNGTRLVLMTRDYPLAWIVLDTADGRQLATIATADHKPFGGGPFFPEFWIDPAGSYLEGLVCACSGEATAPQPAQLVRYDLATGEEVGRLDLPEVLAGSWPAEDGAADGQTSRHLTPGPAVSPDGQRLAIVHADAEAVTLVDLERFAVERTVTISRPTGLLVRVLGLLPLVPQGVAAKSVPAGTLRAATFHPDGRHLYVVGFENWMRPSGGEARRGLGLQLVDLETGAIVAEVAPEASFAPVLPAPDGRSVYVVGGAPDEVRESGTLLRRLDARTLEPLAERRFADWREVLLLPIALGGE